MYTQLSYFWKTFPKVSSIFFKPPSDNHFHDLWTILFSHFYLWPVVDVTCRSLCLLVFDGCRIKNWIRYTCILNLKVLYNYLHIYFKKKISFFLIFGTKSTHFWIFVYFKVHWYCLCYLTLRKKIISSGWSKYLIRLNTLNDYLNIV